METWPSPKSKHELKEQIKDTNKVLAVPISSASINKELRKLTTEEIKEKYTERYEVYLRILRAQKNNQEISEEDILNTQKWIESLNNLDRYIDSHQNRQEKRILREKQFTVFENVRKSLEQGKKEGYIKLPTGVGKTVLFSQIVESLGTKTLICVPSKILVTQTGEKLEEFTDVEFGKYFQHEKDFSKDVTIITYQSLINGIEKGIINPKDYGAIILDEVHKALGGKTSEAINKFNCIKLGFTATPQYTDKNVSELLEHEIHSMSIAEGVNGGLINRFKSIFAHTEVDLSKVKIKQGEYDQDELEKAVNIQARNLSAVQLYKEMFVGQSAIAYCSGVTHAKDMADLFNKYGVSAAAITGTTSQGDREIILKKYHAGEIKVLCNAKVLIEGFDEPHASVALNLHPTLSKVNAEQRAGRVLRLDNDNPEKWAYVVDFIDKNARKPQVTFPEIAGASELSSDIEPGAESRDGSSREHLLGNNKIPEIQGLRIILDTQEVMRMSEQGVLAREASESKRWVFEKLKREVQGKGVKSPKEYEALRQKYKWLSSRNLLLRPEFKGWDDFLDGKKLFQNLKKEVQEKGIKTSGEYARNSPKYHWPSLATLMSKSEFKGWDDFLDRDLEAKALQKQKYFDQLKKEVKEKNISSSTQYAAVAKIYKWPALTTLAAFPMFKDWDDFLGREKFNFEKFKLEVQAKGIKSSTEYIDVSPENKWPNFSTLIKNPKFISWDDFLGREKKLWTTYEDLKKMVREMEVQNPYQYSRLQPKYRWPSKEALIKKPEFTNWGDFLGIENMKEWTVDELKKVVNETNIKSTHQYQKISSIKKWPDFSTVKKMAGFRDWNDFFDTEPKKAWTLSELKKELIGKNVTTKGKYKLLSPKLGWLDHRKVEKLPGFSSWDEFLS